MFFLHRDFGRDPFEVFREGLRDLYRAMERVLRAVAKVLISLLVTSINGKFGLNMNPEHFLDLMCSGSVEEIRSFLNRVAESYGSKGGLGENERR